MVNETTNKKRNILMRILDNIIGKDDNYILKEYRKIPKFQRKYKREFLEKIKKNDTNNSTLA